MAKDHLGFETCFDFNKAIELADIPWHITETRLELNYQKSLEAPFSGSKRLTSVRKGKENKRKKLLNVQNSKF